MKLKNIWKLVSSASLASIVFSANAGAVGSTLSPVPAEVSTKRLRAAGPKDLGPYVSKKPKMSVSLSFKPKNPDGLNSLLKRIYNPKDPLFHHYLTTSQFASQFGADVADYQAAIDFGKSQGLTVETSANRLMIQYSGSQSAIEKSFSVKLHIYQSADSTTFYAPTSSVLLPNAIASKITGAFGLNSFPMAHRPKTARKSGLKTPPPKKSLHASPLVKPSDDNCTNNGLGPSDISTAYNIPTSDSDGTGQSIALVEYDGYVLSDIQEYTSYYNLPSGTLNTILIDGYSGDAGSSSGEVTLDIELALALAPTATVQIYEAENTTSEILRVLNAIANDDNSQQVSISWTTKEYNDDSSFLQSESAYFAQMAAQGQSVFAATGDAGAYNGDSSLSVNDPSSQPYVTGVGGTSLFLNSDGSYSSESAWSGSSGGISSVWSTPWWQSQVTSSSSLGSTTFRNVPDVSLDADPCQSPYNIYQGGSWQLIGGTSAATPLWAALTALANQRRADQSLDSLGFMNPLLYSIYSSQSYANVFNDVNDGSTNGYYPAVNGYDLSTGLGSYYGSSMLTLLTQSASTSSQTPPAPSNFTASGVAADHLDLSWTSGGGQTAGFVLAYAVGSVAPDCATGSALGLVSGASVTSLNPNTTYSFSLCATNGSFYISLPVTASVTTQSVSKGGSVPAPTSLTFTATKSSLTASWASGGGSTAGFDVAFASGTSAPDCSTGSQFASSTTSAVASRLSSNTTYTFSICAVDSNGTLSNPLVGSFSTLGLPPKPPLRLKLAAVSPTEVSVSWASGGGSTASFYLATGAGAMVPSCASGQSMGQSLEASISDLSAGTAYTVALCSANSQGVLSNPVVGRITTPKLPPNAPVNLSITSLSTSLKLSWASGGGSTARYVVAYSAGASAPSCAQGKNVGTATAHTIVGLVSNQAYSVTVCAVNSQGGFSRPASTKGTTLLLPPAKPIRFKEVSRTSSSVSLSWVSGGGSTASFNFAYAKGAAAPSCASGQSVGMAASQTVSGLAPGSVYTFVLCSENSQAVFSSPELVRVSTLK
jgi:kumamolisin